ncbi:FeoA family protein [Campylobacter geochelonis]|uniref:Ferrous iron transport protein A n=1 Tax=Campylobacter geochelonis TaxID=1780362 RepID=A0A128EG03_9BACT|nr:FeoA family protein [Campylobacter geochelonis]QKF71942.1 ferrous iron transport protein A [Campylobacter geochelonis]CZE47178.1 Ferrous iron transport protein A [Campylobacter geochelonis]CZE47831.1 Ferrous iron transport protein A [Campylobacter geochelonis]CZE49978.1 Ferrous iron transport protein A [Campylobacter geochelonis]
MSVLKTFGLDTIEAGKSCKIVKLSAKDKLLQKLLDMGFVNGATIEVVREAPLYDPMELRIHNYILTLRKSEAALIEVYECN